MDEHLKSRIKFLRTHFGLSQIEFAKKIGISQGALSQIEGGRTQISFETLKNISKNFNVDCNWMVLGVGEPFFNQERLAAE